MKTILDPEVIEAIEAGQKIQAIKKLRSITGMGLKEAKEAVDQYIVEYGLTDIYKNNSNPSIRILIILLALGYIIYWFLKNN